MAKRRGIPVYAIDDDVPVPSDAQSRRAEPVPLSKLEPGQSILFPLERRDTVQTQASRLRTLRGKVFTIKKVDEQFARVWRVE